ncbi:DUF4266 domain-containing protein [uncultured Paraglaciecola sp.]|uniref:DUF4266 domain-containing protein n=1 Tax=uncultured Paraglaciecola sp. TaxID=1765024 RepID=UPI00259461E4|nr:DUF4266 domain-containing protein [uncultured Paraglaciecola sp.]
MNSKIMMNPSTQTSKHIPRKLSKTLVCLVLLQLSGCASIGVQPWERQLLAQDSMSLNSEAVEVGLDEHIYFSKEATSGGRAFAGGGCGCN